MQTLDAHVMSGVIPVRYPIIQSVAANRWIDVNNETGVTLTVSLGGRIYLIPPHTTARYAMDNTETFVQFTPDSAANGTTDTVSGTVYNVQDSVPVDIERGASAADILPITSADIADGAVIAAKVATGAILTSKIASGAVTATEIANGAVGTAELANGAVTNPILASLAVANSNIQSAAVATAQIADGAVATTKIANAAITSALIANAAITTALIANAAITTALIQTAAITNALIADVSASKITAGTISATVSIDAPTITGGTYQTAGSGRRINVNASVDVSRFRFFTGELTETQPGGLFQGGSGTNSTLVMEAPNHGSGSASFQVNSDLTGEFSGSHIVANGVGWRTVGGDGVAFGSNWSAAGFGTAPRYMADALGIVHLEGFATNTTNPTTSALFVLPAGYRPPANHTFVVAAGAGLFRLDVQSDGTVIWQQTYLSGDGSFVSLSGISFSTW